MLFELWIILYFVHLCFCCFFVLSKHVERSPSTILSIFPQHFTTYPPSPPSLSFFLSLCLSLCIFFHYTRESLPSFPFTFPLSFFRSFPPSSNSPTRLSSLSLAPLSHLSLYIFALLYYLHMSRLLSLRTGLDWFEPRAGEDSRVRLSSDDDEKDTPSPDASF